MSPPTPAEFITLDVVEQALTFIPADDRDVWVRMAMAIKSEFGEAGFASWDNWSATAESYRQKAALATWRSVKPGGRVGIGSLIHEAKNNGFSFEAPEPTAEQKAAQEKIIQQRREQRKRDQKAFEQQQAQWHEIIKDLSQLLFEQHITAQGSSKYLGTKKVRAHGIGFVRHGFIVLVDDIEASAQVISGADDIKAFFAAHSYDELKAAGKWFIYAKHGTIVVPLRDVNGVVHNCQFIFAEGKKQFIKNGRKSGLFHLIGWRDDADVLLITEGYATGATLHEATACPVAVALDAGNLKPVVVALHARYRGMTKIICGDDDVDTKGNPGRTKADAAAKAVDGGAVFPVFEGVA